VTQGHSGAIETLFHGIYYKSREEAKWAVFFWSLGIPYKYEAEGYPLRNELKYLPDFYLPDQDCFIEIKNETSDLRLMQDHTALEKASYLNEKTGKDVFLFYQIPDPQASDGGVVDGLGAIAWTEKTRKQRMEEKMFPRMFDYLDEYYRGEKEYLPFDFGYFWTQCPSKNCLVTYGVAKGGRADLLPV
jgi:hypothetical protein